MKHFVISITAGHSVFENRCTAMHEAYDAIMDASLGFNINVDADEIMEKLVSMKNGMLLGHHSARWAIDIADGEV